MLHMLSRTLRDGAADVSAHSQGEDLALPLVQIGDGRVLQQHEAAAVHQLVDDLVEQGTERRQRKVLA